MATITEPATLRHWIGGRPHDGVADRFSEVTRSATGE